MTYAEVFGRLRTLLGRRTWSLTVEAFHFPQGNDSLAWRLYISQGNGVFINEPTTELLLEKAEAWQKENQQQAVEEKADEVGEIVIPEAEPEKSEQPAAAPDPDYSF